MSNASAPSSSSWASRPGLARAIRFAVVLIPISSGMAAAVLVSRLLPGGGGVLGFIARTGLVVVVSTVVVWAVDRVARRALPLAALMQLSLVFPDQAPSRFKAALRSGSSRRLERQVDETRRAGLPTDPGQAAIAVIGAIGDHDRRTRGHSERVRLYADLIGEELKLSAEERQKLQWGALLHDLGKLMVPEEILNKPGKPTAEEWAILQKHPAQGEALIEPLRPFLGMWADAIGGHHEKWDGSGYPRGLAGSKIPPSAAIVAVADSFEVMTAIRSYKSAMSMSDARAELTRCAGTHFDPEVVRAMLSVSLGRLRMAMGPLASLAHLPFLDHVARLQGTMTSAGSGAASAAASAVPSVVGGLVAATLAVGVVGPSPGVNPSAEVVTVEQASSPSGPDATGNRPLGAPVAAEQGGVGITSPSGDAVASDDAAGAAPITEPDARPGSPGDVASGGSTGGERENSATTEPGRVATVAPGATGSATTSTTRPTTTTTRPSTTTTVTATTLPPDTTSPPSTIASTTTVASGATTIMVSKNEWRTNATSLQGESFAPGATIYVFLNGLSGSTQWWLAPDDSGAPYSADGTTPFDLVGTNANLAAKPYTVPTTPGTYWVTVKRNGSGTSLGTASFTVA